jgi:hypothetical protein
MGERVKATCAKCGKTFDMGWTGVCPNGVDLCDECFGIERPSRASGCLKTFNTILFIILAIGIVLLLTKYGIFQWILTTLEKLAAAGV